MSIVHSIWYAGIVVALWTCKRDAQWKWSFYVCVACRENLWWILSLFARATFCDLIGHLKFCQSGLSFDFELIYSPSLSFIKNDPKIASRITFDTFSATSGEGI